MRRVRPLLLVAAVLFTTLLAGCAARGGDPGRLRVVAAASLRGVMDRLAELFESAHPGVEVEVETGGSNALARRALELRMHADVLFLADTDLFIGMLEPGWTDFHLRYASDRIVIGYTEDSVAAGEIDEANWSEVLVRDGVAVGMADPNRAPAGYRTLMTLKLYDLHNPGAGLERAVRAKVGERHLRPDVAELLAPLQTGVLDYAFLYGVTAAQAGLRIVSLPPALSLGDPDLAADYARVEVDVVGREPGSVMTMRGGPIVYGASVPKDREHDLGVAFLELAFSEPGRRILAAAGFGPLVGPAVRGRGSPPRQLLDALDADQ